MQTLTGKTALITGASSGIGAALAREFARRGASLILLARNRERLEAVRTDALRIGAGDVRLAAIDLTDYPAVDRFVQTLEGRIDYLILNAGISQRSAYCAAKHALKGYFEALQLETGMRVTLLFPGRINTPISLSALEGDGRAHGKMDPGQAGGMDADVCARKCVAGILRGRRQVRVGGREMIACFVYKWFPGLFFRFAGNVSAV